MHWYFLISGQERKFPLEFTISVYRCDFAEGNNTANESATSDSWANWTETAPGSCKAVFLSLKDFNFLASPLSLQLQACLGRRRTTSGSSSVWFSSSQTVQNAAARTVTSRLLDVQTIYRQCSVIYIGYQCASASTSRWPRSSTSRCLAFHHRTWPTTAGVVADARERRLRSTASRTCVVTRTDITRPSAIEQHLTNDRRTPQPTPGHYF